MTTTEDPGEEKTLRSDMDICKVAKRPEKVGGTEKIPLKIQER